MTHMLFIPFLSVLELDHAQVDCKSNTWFIPLLG